jgi:hypothetical protein
MKYLIKPATLIIWILLITMGCAGNKEMIFNGKNLDNWEIYSEDSGVAPDSLFWVEDGMIQTTGKPKGYIRTKGIYGNFKLHVEWRWAEEPTNSGVLVRVQGPDMIWPHAVECQLKHGSAGDLVLMRTGAAVTVEGKDYQVTSEEDPYIIIAKQNKDSEYAPGEWNSYDITLQDGTIEVLVNGVLQNSGSGLTLTEGNILLQSEGSPIQFRNIYLERP